MSSHHSGRQLKAIDTNFSAALEATHLKSQFCEGPMSLEVLGKDPALLFQLLVGPRDLWLLAVLL